MKKAKWILLLILLIIAAMNTRCPGQTTDRWVLTLDESIGCPPLVPTESFNMTYKGNEWYVTVDNTCKEITTSSKGIVVVFRADEGLIYKELGYNYDGRGFPPPSAIRRYKTRLDSLQPWE